MTERETALARLAKSLASRVLRPVLEYANVVIGGYATTRFMREGKNEIGKPNRTPVLRRITGRLSRSLTGAREIRVGFSDEAISEIVVLDDGKAVLRKGSKVPYAVLHEQGATVAVKAHTRRVAQKADRAALSPLSDNRVDVKAHTRSVNARPFLGPATRKAQPMIIDRMKTLLKRWAQTANRTMDKLAGGTDDAT